MVSLNITMKREGRIEYKACPISYITDHMWTEYPDKLKHLTSQQQLSNLLQRLYLVNKANLVHSFS